MSVRNIYWEDLSPVPGRTISYGRTFSLVSSGTNQVGEGELIPHPYTLTLHDRCSFLWHNDYKYCGGTSNPDYNAGSVSYTASRAWTSADDYDLYGRLEEKYDKGDFNAGIFAGELGETVDMLAGRAKQLAKALKAAKKGNFAKAAKVLTGSASNRRPPPGSKPPKNGEGLQSDQRVSDGWLELQYGWMPLLGDIHSLADQIAQRDKPRRKKIIARHAIRWTAKTNVPGIFNATGGGQHRKQIIAYITEDIPSWPQALGLTDPELVAWELVPFSFVVDWFLPVGNWLQARAFAQRAKGTFVITESKVFSGRAGDAVNPGCAGIAHAVRDTVGWYRYVYVNRIVTTNLPQVPLPTFSNGIGKGWRLQNAAALLASIFGGNTYRPRLR